MYEGDDAWKWAGNIVLQPLFGDPTMGRRTIGLHIRGMPYEAIRTDPLVHRFCQIDLLGPGVVDCDPWIDALISNRIICRGLVGQLIGCHGIGYEIVPLVNIAGIVRPQGASVSAEGEYTFIIVAGVTFTRHVDGWRYSRDDFPEQGPFPEPEDAARDAAARLRWPDPVRGYAADLLEDEGHRRLMVALRRETALTADRRD